MNRSRTSPGRPSRSRRLASPRWSGKKTGSDVVVANVEEGKTALAEAVTAWRVVERAVTFVNVVVIVLGEPGVGISGLASGRLARMRMNKIE